MKSIFLWSSFESKRQGLGVALINARTCFHCGSSFLGSDAELKLLNANLISQYRSHCDSTMELRLLITNALRVRLTRSPRRFEYSCLTSSNKHIHIPIWYSRLWAPLPVSTTGVSSSALIGAQNVSECPLKAHFQRSDVTAPYSRGTSGACRPSNRSYLSCAFLPCITASYNIRLTWKRSFLVYDTRPR